MNFSGYDSEAVGFTSVSRSKRAETSTSTQTTEFGETGAGCQTNLSKDAGSITSADDIKLEPPNYSPQRLNEFLKRVVPTMLEQLDENDRELLYNSSESDEDESATAKLVQELDVKLQSNLASGDQKSPCILSLSWSSAGNSLAVSLGFTQHENWCDHDGVIKIFTIKRTAGDKFVHTMDVNEKNCVSCVKYHHSLAALMAYGTISGEVVIINMRDASDFYDGTQLTSPSGCHGAKRVTALQWADAALANLYLTMHITNTGKRRGASDQILFSSGSDGTLNVWQVNSNFKVFENVICYGINGSRNIPAPDITCFDFIKAYPLRPSDEKVPDDVFVVGSSTGKLYLCKIKTRKAVDENAVDPVYEVFDGHATCVLDVAFSLQKPGLFASISIDSELRLYDINQYGPLKVMCLDVAVSCMSWLTSSPCVVVGTCGKGERLRVYNIGTGREVAVEGLGVDGTVTALAVSHCGSCRIAAGDSTRKLRLWELPARRGRLIAEEEF
ncbi:dynein axonemal intermediate chain 1-like [Amyelois transitella]|uniref:dynein axonemal intermediate chain 1-like n=1 Tax=Amyelois transitella TaxID=680683 RepID=UPI00298F8F65|nr:dynein axonemal intermediate chain 1-like [Amyelois transitella]